MPAVTTFSSMIEQSISISENGIVNFQLLRAFLHSLIQHLQLSDTTVKYDETLVGNGEENIENFDSKRDQPQLTQPRRKWSKGVDDDRFAHEKETTQSNSKDSKYSSGFIQPEISESLGRLEQKVTKIESKLEAAENLSGHEELLSRTSTEPSSTPFSDALKLISISKRMDACEESLKKFAPAIEDLAKDGSNRKRKFNDLARQLVNLVPGLEGINESPTDDKKSTENFPTGRGSRFSTKRVSLMDIQQSEIDNKFLEAFAEMQHSLITLKDEMNDLMLQQKNILSASEMIPNESLSELQNQLSELKLKIEKWDNVIPEVSVNIESEKISQLEDQLKEHSERISGLHENLAEQINQSQGQIADLEKELGVLLEKVNTSAKNEVSDMTSLGELYQKIINLQANMDVLNETSTRLTADHEDKQMNIDGLLEQMELIKLTKADKEALEDALTEKADALTVNRKVSHDQFDAAFEELNRTIVDAQTQLSQQERGWLNALEEVQKEIQSKIDRIEIAPLKDMIENKMQNIQERIKAMAAKRQEIEALGTKKKLLRNLNCLSCDKRVVMRTTLNGSALPMIESLPPNRSMRPYLTYELDQVRQKQKRLPGRNLLHFENAVAEQRLMETGPKGDQKENHLCSRYCGGSHTIVTNQQRVSRVGHFPEGVILNGQVQGTRRSEGNVHHPNEITNSPFPTPRSNGYEP